MGNITSLYLTEETRSLLDERKKKDPDFNLSAFIYDKLSEGREGYLDTNMISMEIEKKNAQINQIRMEVQILEDKKFKLEAKRKLDAEEKEQEIIRQERRKLEFIKSYSENLLYYFEISKKYAEDIANEVWNTPKEQRKSILDEGKSRGLLEKEIK